MQVNVTALVAACLVPCLAVGVEGVFPFPHTPHHPGLERRLGRMALFGGPLWFSPPPYASNAAVGFLPFLLAPRRRVRERRPLHVHSSIPMLCLLPLSVPSPIRPQRPRTSFCFFERWDARLAGPVPTCPPAYPHPTLTLSSPTTPSTAQRGRQERSALAQPRPSQSPSLPSFRI